MYKKAFGKTDQALFTGYKFVFVGTLADTHLAIGKLVERFGGHICGKSKSIKSKHKFHDGIFILDNQSFPWKKKKGKKGGVYAYDYPNIVICSAEEANADTPSTQIQGYKNLGVSNE